MPGRTSRSTISRSFTSSSELRWSIVFVKVRAHCVIDLARAEAGHRSWDAYRSTPQTGSGAAPPGRDHGAVEVIDRAADQPVADVRDGLFRPARMATGHQRLDLEAGRLRQFDAAIVVGKIRPLVSRGQLWRCRRDADGRVLADGQVVRPPAARESSRRRTDRGS